MEQQYPLTKQQEGLWVEWRLHPDNTSYNTCVKLRLTGDLDTDRFDQALQHVVDFFSSLRVYFVEENAVPFQRVKEKGEFTLEFEDISISGQAETPAQRKQAEEFLAKMLRTPVDLKTFPIVRSGLIKTADEVHYFIGIVPHMISDGVSAVLFLEATSIAYNKGYDGLVEAYGSAPKDWGDYFGEDSQKDDPEKWKEAAAYWSERMDGAQHVVDFSYGQAESSNATKTGKRVYFDLPENVSQGVKDYSRSQRTTHFSTLVAAFGLLIKRYYDQDNVLVGYPVNIRPPGYKHLFGFFVNIIPIRVDLSGNPTFEELVARVNTSRKADKKYQTFPAMDLVREIRKNTPGFDGRVFNASMAQTVSRLVNLRLDGIQSDPLEAEYNDVNDDLSLSYELLENGQIGLWLEYRQSLFEAEFIDQMIKHMQSLLAQVIADPHKPLNEYDLLNDDLRAQITQWNTPDCLAHKYTQKHSADTIHDMIENAVAENPEAIAMRYKEQNTTYAQLNANANTLARHIQCKGAGVGDTVALCLKRGPQMITALLAVLKAGCTYVPIPPDYPAERLEFILKNAGCKLVLTQSDLEGNFEDIDAPEILSLDTLDETLDEYDDQNLNLDITGKDHCYIIYTSGSTGRPKGVLLSHENVVPRLGWLQDEIPLDISDVVLQNTDYSFDVSVAEIFWPLTTGAKLVLTDFERYKDPAYLIDLMNTEGVTTTCFVPSLLNSVLAVMKDQKLTALKRILAAGEALPPSLIREYYAKCSGDLYNIYGPTEAAIYAAFTKCENDPEINRVPIGRPLAETTLYILDPNGQPQPTGVAGELYIGGIGVAQKYMNLPELSAERFLPDRFAKDDNARMYKTGDLCRFLSDGNIEYLGRIDSQVKIRGFRIELAEIETILAKHDNIEDVAVIDFGASGEHKRLVAYYVAGDGKDIEADELRDHIASALPEYMIPAFFARIDAVPRLASGKINRCALPNPEHLVKKRAAYVAPRNKTEEQIVGIWSDILRIPVDKIGVHDSFFDIGGDSLMAIQFACTAEENGIDLDTSAVFEYNTIAQLAKVSEQGTCDKPTIDQVSVSGTYPLLPRQDKFLAEDFANPHHWNRYFAFEIDHDADLKTLQSAFDRVLMHHDNLRVKFEQDENGEWQQYCTDSVPDVPYLSSHDLSALSESEQKGEIIRLSNAAHTDIRIDTAPLIRVLHFKITDTQGFMSVIIHHLLVDIVSSRMIFEDFLKSYESLRRNIDAPLFAKTTSVKEWAMHLNTLAAEHDFKDEIAYWSQEDVGKRTNLPRKENAPQKAPESNAKNTIITLDEEQTAALLQTIPASIGANIQDVLLSALSDAINIWTGDKTMVVNICGHGRDGGKTADLSRTVGWLNTVFPVILKSDAQNNRDKILNTKAQIQNVPASNGAYNILRYLTKHPEITKHAPPELFFNYVSQIDALIPEGLSISPVEKPKDILSSDPQNALEYALYIEAGVYEKQTQIHVTYSHDIFDNEQIEKFITFYKSSVINMIEGIEAKAA